MTAPNTVPVYEWQGIESAPKDGTEIQARIPGNGEDNVIAWQSDAFLGTDGDPCGGWAFTRDQEPPDCWTDGVCWSVNEDEVASIPPTHWKPLPEVPMARCSLGVGCDEAGVCYAAAHGKPEMCGAHEPSSMDAERLDDGGGASEPHQL